jgi:hypothetical protein
MDIRPLSCSIFFLAVWTEMFRCCSSAGKVDIETICPGYYLLITLLAIFRHIRSFCWFSDDPENAYAVIHVCVCLTSDYLLLFLVSGLLVRKGYVLTGAHTCLV